MTKLTDNRKATFLLFLSEGNTVTLAARAIGVSRQAAYQYRDNDPEFRQLWDNAIEEGIDTLENEAITRAKKSSDLLLIFLLKAKRPDVYRDQIEINVNWRNELKQVGVDPEQHLQALIDQARQLLEQNADIIDVTPMLELGESDVATGTDRTDSSNRTNVDGS